MKTAWFVCSLALVALALAPARSSALEPEKTPVRGSMVEDRAARKLLEAGDARFDSDEFSKAVEVWQSVIERYPRSKVRFDAHMRLGNYLLERDRAYDRARTHFEAVAAEDNRDEEQRAQATLKLGVCFYEARNYGKCFKVMRDIIEHFPTSTEVNQAYYYIGLGHFQLGHYSRAIAALEKVGTALVTEGGKLEKVEAGKRLFVKIDDADLAALPADTVVKVLCQTTQGDEETVNCLPVGHNVRIVLGSVVTALGKPVPNNGTLELRGDDSVKVTYIDQHTADREFDRPVLKEIQVVGDALVDITDGAFSESLRGVVLGRSVNFQITDADRDLSDEADKIKAVVEVYREKTPEELEAEQAAAAIKAPDAAAPNAAAPLPTAESLLDQPKADAFKLIDRVEVTLIEVPLVRSSHATSDEQLEVGDSSVPPASKTAVGDSSVPPASKTAVGDSSVPPASKTAVGDSSVPSANKTAVGDSLVPSAGKTAVGVKKDAAGKAATKQPVSPGAATKNAASKDAPAAAPAQAAVAADDQKAQPTPKPVDDGTIHSGVFRATLSLVKADRPTAGDDTLQALPNDIVRVTYLDERSTAPEAHNVTASAHCVEGNLGGVRVTRAQISDQELRIQTQLKTASALTNIGNRYKEFGLKKNAEAKYNQALKVCEEITQEALKLGGRLLEETYVQLWQIYYEMDQLDLAAAMCQRLQREFPNSGFVDDALLQLAGVVRKQGDLGRSIAIYSRLVDMQTSQLRGEAQFGIAECYEEMAKKSNNAGSGQLFDRSFQEYKKVFDSFPESGRVGEAVSKMANYYYQQKDYVRAIDIFENVLTDHPDAKFLDVILFNYGRCLYRLERKAEARKQFDQLIADFPESPLATDAKRISDALVKSGPAPK